MADPRVDTVARILVEYSLDVQEGQLVRLLGKPESAPLLLSLYQRILERGAHPWLQLELEGEDEIFLTFANDAQLDYLSPLQKQIIETIDASIHVWSEVNTRRLTHVAPARQARRRRTMRPVFERFIERLAQKELRWTGTLYPTAAFAQDAEMSLREFEDFVYTAALVHEPDPIGAWRAVSQRQQQLIERLRPTQTIHLVGPDTDLTFSLVGRTWINCDGRENFPDGEIFTSPVENSLQGTIRFSYPACLFGREVEDIRLRFEQGRVVEAHAAKNQDFLQAMLDTDEGSRYVGEFAFGTNPGIQRFTRNVLFDEKIGGTVHLALGKGFPEAGGCNSSAIHWDLVCDLRQGGSVYADDQLVAHNGAFTF